MSAPGSAAFRALGTGVRVLTTDPGRLGAARRAVEDEVAAIDAACSRFRDDSELCRVNRAAGVEVTVGPLLAEVLEAALRAARMTGGAVDPTVAAALLRVGYDRDFDLGLDRPEPPEGDARAVPGWATIALEGRRLRRPRGVEIDLGATAKALAADRAAGAARAAAGCGVLVSLGGDLAMVGDPPRGGWRVLVTDDQAAPPDGPGAVIAVTAGGLATSSTTVRRWERGGRAVHHIIDPATGLPALEHWKTVSVGAATCVDANAASTASIVWGLAAPSWLERHRLPARLVAVDGRVSLVGGWPAEGVS